MPESHIEDGWLCPDTNTLKFSDVAEFNIGIYNIIYKTVSWVTCVSNERTPAESTNTHTHTHTQTHTYTPLNISQMQTFNLSSRNMLPDFCKNREHFILGIFRESKGSGISSLHIKECGHKRHVIFQF